MRATTALLLGALCAATAGCSQTRQLNLSPCHLKGLPEEVYCGELTVLENRDSQQGRTIPIQIALLPALRRSARPDPVMVMAGGPGQGARSYAPLLARSFRAIRRTRDIVLVDLRGTGGSRPLNCPTPQDELDALTDLLVAGSPSPRVQQQVADCLSALDADPRQFTHAQSLADLNDVQRALGYTQVNLWGGSWGTRAALLYASRYPASVRSVVLDGAVPLSMDFPETASADAQRALDLLYDDCEEDPACHAAFPQLREMVHAILSSAAGDWARVAIRHPRTDAIVPVALPRAAIVEMVRASLYSAATVSRLPAILSVAAGGDLAPLVAQWFEIASSTTETMAFGATLSVLCSEEMTDAAPASARSTASVFGTVYADFWMSRCRYWPKGPSLPRGERDPLTTPALILSGGLDPVTPPHWGDVMARTFARSAHVVVPRAAHNASFGGCVPEVIAEFFERADPDALDTRCVEDVRRPPFALDSAGGRP